MDCKNCSTSLSDVNKFCPECGAKVMRNRLTFKNIFDQLNEQYLNVDNKLLRTFLGLITKPEHVINGYIDGLRKRYVDAISYLAISLTLFGFQIFILRTFFSEKMSTTPPTGNKELDELSVKFIDVIFDYMGLISILFIPIIALATYVVYLDKKKHNYIEHIAVNIYVTAEYTILTFFIFFVLLAFNIGFNTNFLIISVITYLYMGYAYKKNIQLKYSFCYW